MKKEIKEQRKYWKKPGAFKSSITEMYKHIMSGKTVSIANRSGVKTRMYTYYGKGGKFIGFDGAGHYASKTTPKAFEETLRTVTLGTTTLGGKYDKKGNHHIVATKVQKPRKAIKYTIEK